MKTLTSLILFFNLSCLSAQWSIVIDADSPNWISLHENIKVSPFNAGDNVIITANGFWTNKGSTYSYNGQSNFNSSNVTIKCNTMALLVKVIDNGLPKIYEFGSQEFIKIPEFQGKGEIEFICNSDMTTKRNYSSNTGSVTATVKLYPKF